jgi:hypothetical protein
MSVVVSNYQTMIEGFVYSLFGHQSSFGVIGTTVKGHGLLNIQ